MEVDNKFSSGKRSESEPTDRTRGKLDDRSRFVSPLRAVRQRPVRSVVDEQTSSGTKTQENRLNNSCDEVDGGVTDTIVLSGRGHRIIGDD